MHQFPSATSRLHLDQYRLLLFLDLFFFQQFAPSRSDTHSDGTLQRNASDHSDSSAAERSVSPEEAAEDFRAFSKGMRGETVKAVDGKAYKLIKNAGLSSINSSS